MFFSRVRCCLLLVLLLLQSLQDLAFARFVLILISIHLTGRLLARFLFLYTSSSRSQTFETHESGVALLPQSHLFLSLVGRQAGRPDLHTLIVLRPNGRNIHWHTVVLVERLIRHRWRIDSWHTWRIDCRKLLDWDVVDGRRWGRGCVVHGTVRCTDCLFLDRWGNVQLAIPQHDAVTIALQSLRFVFRFERHETVAFTDARPVDDDFRGLDVTVRRE